VLTTGFDPKPLVKSYGPRESVAVLILIADCYPSSSFLTHAPWPGNVRQLRNEVTRLAACARGSTIEVEDLWEGIPAPEAEAAVPVPAPGTTPQSLKKAIEDLERRMIGEALASTKNNQQQAAKMLGLSRQGLINKLKRYSL